MQRSNIEQIWCLTSKIYCYMAEESYAAYLHYMQDRGSASGRWYTTQAASAEIATSLCLHYFDRSDSDLPEPGKLARSLIQVQVCELGINLT